ncbi:ParB/RepB/Spo0J family partition protein [Clostridium hydrogeniformans]|uniref:ParB/RepB/Spo0J family partition protein n=1 Tax=Clostridium hydrogeniformans TaxID=349933 RepID=UPI00047F187A|nr:ParB/RepB/Spo0J family partition protein [Clostridium hydrogeniformans]
MSKKFGLGKGLGALIPEEQEEKIIEKNESNLISINLIKPNNEQPRTYFDEQKILELSESIKEYGVIQPLILKKEKSNYIIIAGERRWRAAKKAGVKEVPAVIMDLSDKEVLEVSLIENIQRQDLNPIEEAIAYEKLLREFELTQEELSKKLGKSRVVITNSLRLLKLDDRVKDYLIDGVISEGHGRILLSIGDKNLQYTIAQRVIDEDLSVRALEGIIKNIRENKNKDDNNEKSKKINPYYVDVKEKLQQKFDTKININSKRNKGKIEIEYYSEEDLQRILDILQV